MKIIPIKYLQPSVGRLKKFPRKSLMFAVAEHMGPIRPKSRGIKIDKRGDHFTQKSWVIL